MINCDPQTRSPLSLDLLAWTDSGELVLDTAVELRTLSLSGGIDHPHRDGDGGTDAAGEGEEADLIVPALGRCVAFIRPTSSGATLFLHGSDVAASKHLLSPGCPTSVAGLTWLIIQRASTRRILTPGAGTDQGNSISQALEPCSYSITDPISAQLSSQLMAWLAQPMVGPTELRTNLKEFLALVARGTAAGSGMLVLAEGNGFSLVTAFGLSNTEAEDLWGKMPHSLIEDLMRTNARVLLPDELRKTAPADSTVFIRGIRSLAGFPVFAEGRLVAIFYLGFDNLLRSLSSDLQQILESAANMLGMVIQRAQLREDLEQLKLMQPTTGTTAIPQARLMVGSSERLIATYKVITRLAPVDVATLITGETGTGKELAAKELHRLSQRAARPFIVVNAAALPESLIESELFGHKKGAFTGALSDRVGLVEQAEGGTLFIDEIGELSLPMQAKLLRVLQEYAVTRIGETTPRLVDFRLVTATHRNLQELVASGQFREDLYYRIAGAIIHMPALRDRSGDIIVLANFFRQQFAQRHGLPDKEWSQDALQALISRSWPGNIRELENAVARAFVMADGLIIRRRDLDMNSDGHLDAQPTHQDVRTISARQGACIADSLDTVDSLADAEGHETISLTEARDHWMRSFLIKALYKHKGHRAETAKALGIGERTLFRYLEQLDIRDV